MPSVPLAAAANAFLFTCDDGMACLGRVVVGAMLLFAAAPTLIVLLPVAPTLPPWVTVVVALATSLPLWWWAARTVALRSHRDRTQPSWSRWAVWWGALTTGWSLTAVLVFLAVAGLLARFR